MIENSLDLHVLAFFCAKPGKTDMGVVLQQSGDAPGSLNAGFHRREL